MIVRIVKMTFQPEKVDAFLTNFDKNKTSIRAFKGCNKLELLKQKDRSDVYFTYSWWDDESALNDYRHSDLFAGVWKTTKTFFADKPEAWSLENIREL
jgi:heme-degrading monooxygenase HmoA